MTIDLNTLVAALRAALPIAKQLADFTPSVWDNKAVEVLEAMLNNTALLNFLRALLGIPEVVESHGPARTVAIQAACEANATPEVQAAAESAGIPWALILQYAPQVITLVLTLLGKRR